MSNILYSVQVKPQEEDATLVIDSNELLEQCIEERKKQEQERVRYKKKKEHANDEFEDVEYPDDSEEFEQFAPLEPEPVEPPEPEIDYVALAQEEADNILMQARMQADEILAEAENQAHAMQTNAEVVGQKQGYERGLQDAAMKQLEWENETERLRQSLQQDYQCRQQNMEKELVDIVCEVVEKVFLIQFGDDKNLIMHLLDNALSNVESSREFLIRVNEANAEFLRTHKEELQQKVGSEVTLDIAIDPLLDDSQCMIETDGGLFDCSMDVEMRNLIKDIKSLN